MSFQPISQINVSLKFEHENLPVGRIAQYNQKIYFEYDTAFSQRNLNISPIKCPTKHGVQTFDPFLFEGLPGVFYDSLPDGWGRLLLDRKMKLHGMLPQELSAVDRLAYVGKSGMGALIYEPDHSDQPVGKKFDINVVAKQASEVLAGNSTGVLTELLALNGASAGTRPKAMIALHKSRQKIIYDGHKLDDNYQPWLVKFPNTYDGADAGAIEYVYALMAIHSGLEISDVHLFPSDIGSGYFATKRFDRKTNGQRLHMHSVCGLLHSDFRVPSLDYKDLLALMMILTKDIREVEKVFRLAVFNVLAHNRDDHTKNFSFLMAKTGEWKFSPAYDLTFASGHQGEQSTTVMGEGKDPQRKHLIKLGFDAKLKKNTIKSIIEQTEESLHNWPQLAKTYGVSRENTSFITSRLTSKNT